MRALVFLATFACSCVGLQDFGDRPSTPSDDASIDGGGDAGPPPSGAVLVPAGSFTVVWGGIHRQSGSTSQARLTRDFYLDAHEVTVGQFRAFVDAGMPSPCPGATCAIEPGGPYAETMRWNPADDPHVASPMFKTKCTISVTSGDKNDVATYPLGNDALPVNCVTFAQALAYCRFRGMRLPTEIEWYYVASGRGQQRTWPWGDTEPKDCTHAIFGIDVYESNRCNFPKPVLAAPGDVSRDGVRDMGGSLSEWVFGVPGKFVQPSTLPDDWAGDPRTDDKIMIKGGNFVSRADYMKTSYAWRGVASQAYTNVGFRCAKTKL